MSLKMKLTSTICAFFLVLGITIMGVLATPNATVNLGGTITFQATNVYAIVNGSITGAVESEAVAGKVLNLETLRFDNETDVIAEGAKWSNTNLSFDNLGSQITITITIENKATDRPLYAKVEETLGKVDNLTKSMTRNGNTYTGGMLTLPKSTGDGTSIETIVLTMKVDDPNVSLANNLTYGYKVSLQDESFATDPDNVADIVEQQKLAYILDDTTMTASVKMVNTTTTTGDIEVPMFVKDGDKVYTVTSVAREGFGTGSAGCTGLTSITLPDSIEVLKDYAFSACTNLKQVNMPSRLREIGMGAFNSTKISELNLPNTLTILGPYAFRNCKNLTKVILPESLTNFGTNAFNGCSNLEYTISNNIKYLGTANNDYFIADAVVDTSAKSYTLNENCKILGSNTFAKNTTVQEVNLPEGMEIINDFAFNQCAKLINADLPSSLKYLGKAAFQYCYELVEINIPNGITSIGDYTFNECYSLTSVNIPTNLVSLGRTAFQYCKSLVSEIIIPQGVTVINAYAFNNCHKIPKVTLSGVKYIDDYAFQNCTELTSITLPEGLEKIGAYAFNSCSLADINKMPSTVKEIGLAAFQNCSGLTSITLPTELEYIGDYALNHCDGATNTTITIPSSIKQIGGTTYDPENPDLNVIGSHVFYDMATETLKEYKMEENEHFMVVDGVLYRKDAEGNPSVMVAYPSKKEGSTYEMPNTVVDAFELSLSRTYHLRTIVLSDSFVIRNNQDENLNNKNWGNNLAMMIYIYSGVTTITCKDTNPNYMTYSGAVYSKDGTTLYYAPMLSGLNVNNETKATLTIKEGTTTIFYGALGCDSDYLGNYAPENNTDSSNHLKRFDKVYIPESVKNIDASVITNINTLTWTIEVDARNTDYKVNSQTGKLETIA